AKLKQSNYFSIPTFPMDDHQTSSAPTPDAERIAVKTSPFPEHAYNGSPSLPSGVLRQSADKYPLGPRQKEKTETKKLSKKELQEMKTSVVYMLHEYLRDYRNKRF